MATTLEQLLANRNSWSQDINLEFCQGQKDIFRGSVPVEASSKEMFPLVPGAEIPVSLFDFELHSLFEEATVKSGCKWWCRRSRPSVAKQYVPKSLLNVVFLCRHYEKTYSKQEKDDSRTTRHLLRCGCTASCTMKAVSVRMHMPAEGLSLTSLKVDVTNRGHGHLVICSSKTSVEQGKLCDAIARQCVEASKCSRKMDVSTSLAVFEFIDADAAEAMLNQSMPNITMEKARPYYWVVQSLDSRHSGHCQPYRECEKSMYLTYAMKMAAKSMADSGISASDIADYLSSRGCSGTLTDKRMKYHINVVRQDLNDFTATPRPGESEAAALIRLLQEKKCKFMYLYTNAPSTKTKGDHATLTVVTSNDSSATLAS